jgi:secretion/DNA translocation related TadE-like protein
MTRRNPPTERDERGVAAPLAVTLGGLLVALAVVGCGLGRLLVDQRVAAAAADLAALAGATAVQRGGDPCEAATRTASANDAELVACRVEGEEVVVRAAARPVTGAGPVGRLVRDVRVVVQARAGPVP